MLSHERDQCASTLAIDLVSDWIATKNGRLDTLLAMIETGEMAHGQKRAELLAAITAILDAGCVQDTAAPTPDPHVPAGGDDINDYSLRMLQSLALSLDTPTFRTHVLDLIPVFDGHSDWCQRRHPRQRHR